METMDILQSALSELKKTNSKDVITKARAKGIVSLKESKVLSDKSFVFDLHGLFDEVINSHSLSWLDVFPDRENKSIEVKNTTKGLNTEALSFFCLFLNYGKGSQVKFSVC